MAQVPTTHDHGSAALADALTVSFRVLRFVMVLLLVAYVVSGIFIVRQDEKAFVLMFGKVAGLGAERVKGPGIHWTFPRPISDIVRVKSEQVQAVESATFAFAATDPMQLAAPGKEGYSLTGDANLMHSRWVLRYQIADPEAYLFRVRDNRAVLLRELDHAVTKSSGRFAIDRALRTDIEAFRGAVAEEITQRCQALGLGVQIVGVELQVVAPPRAVADAFNEVVAAEQERSEKISAARGYASRAVNEAHGQAAKLLAEGEAYQRRTVSEVSADADYFNKVYTEYVKNPDVIARTLLQDTLRRTLAGVENKFILPDDATGKQELRLLLNREQQSPWTVKKPEAPPN